MNEDWKAGALAEAEARNEGMSASAREVRDVLEGFARLNQELGAFELSRILIRIYSAKIPLRKRARLAWELIRS